ncbi:MAG: FAD binding domain-containing protein [Desulfobulbia bacterium]
MRYVAPDTVDAAVGLLTQNENSTRLLAGGTDLLVLLRSELIEPDLIVDVKKISELTGISSGETGFTVGAAVSAAEVGEFEPLRKAWPGVVEGLELIGSTQIQGRATFGGNICNASPAADSVPCLIAAGATASVAGTAGRREIPMASFITGPGQTVLEEDEILVSIHLPKPEPRTGSAYLRFIPRTEMDIAVVGAGICLTVGSEGRLNSVRLALGAVAEKPILVDAVADCLAGLTINDESLTKLDELAQAACRPIDDKRGTREFRTRVAGVLTRRACKIAYDRAKNDLA